MIDLNNYIDDILSKVFEIIGTTNKYFVEFNNNYINKKEFINGLHFTNLNVNSSNINIFFEIFNIPYEFDLLSINIKGEDFHIWNTLDEKYKPRLVIIKYNHYIDTGSDKVMKREYDYALKYINFCGASITATKKLGNKKNYSLIATCNTNDAFFLRNDLLLDNQFININDEYKLVKINKKNINLTTFSVFDSSDKYLL